MTTKNHWVITVSYLIEKELGGGMTWAIDLDDFGKGFPLTKAIKQILDNPATRPPLPSKPEPEPEAEVPFPWDLVGTFPADWSESVQLSRSTQDAATRGLDTNLSYGILGSPAVAVFKDKIYCVHAGQKNDGWLWYCTFDGERWSDDIKLSIGTSASPALAVYNGKLYCVREGQNGDGWLWYCSTSDGENWSEDTKLALGTGSSRRGYPPAALAVYQGKLYCVHEGQHGDGWLWYCTFDGKEWSKDTKMDFGTSAGPALAVLNDQLYCLHEGQNQDGWLWYTSFNAEKEEWSKDVKLQQSTGMQSADVRGKGDGLGISGPPALLVYEELLYILHHGQNEEGHLWGIIADGGEQRDGMLYAGGSGIGTSFSPGLVAYKNAFHGLHSGQNLSGWLWWITLSSNVQPPQPEEYNLEMPPERPGAPYDALDRYNTHLTEHQPLRDDNHPVEVMRHHIIPDNRLRELWNRMLAQDQLHVAREELLLTIEQNLEQYQMNLHPGDIVQLRSLLQSIRTSSIRHNPAAPRPDGFDDLAAVYEWLPGNLFIGPRGGGGEYQRSDDPGDGFEENADTIIGADFPHREANSEIEEYLRSGGEEHARRAMAGLARIAVRAEPYALNYYDWIYAHGRYQLRRREF